jgi:hypothetical protein
MATEMDEAVPGVAGQLEYNSRCLTANWGLTLRRCTRVRLRVARRQPVRPSSASARISCV